MVRSESVFNDQSEASAEIRRDENAEGDGAEDGGRKIGNAADVHELGQRFQDMENAEAREIEILPFHQREEIREL